MLYKYPRTYHLPWSLGTTDDDKILETTQQFNNKQVIVTEKIDGENTTLYTNYYHARSLDSSDHESQHWLKAFHAQIKYNIPFEYRICGENVFAKHSIYYDKLPSYFLCFSIWVRDICLSWEDTQKWAETLGINLVPVLYKGIWNEEIIKQCYSGESKYGIEQEGYVVRLAESFQYKNFDQSVAKFVRKDHVVTNKHWKQQEIIKNQMCL